jgi:hypothetical protein
MIEDEVARVNESGAIDFAVWSATPEQLVVIGFVDDPTSLRIRLVFDEPAYVQMPWTFSGRLLEWQPAVDLMKGAPHRRAWELPDRQSVPNGTPSLTFETIQDAAQAGGALFTFRSHGSSPAEPSCFVLARGITAISKGAG